jgi:hypothetical protein
MQAPGLTLPQEFAPGRIWLSEYPILYFGCAFNARMTLIRMEDGKVLVHSPAPLTDENRAFVAGLGPVVTIIAPGKFHHFYARQWHDAYGDAELFICPSLERRVPALRHGTVIEDGARYSWSAELDHVVVRGSLIVTEVAFLHRPTCALLLTDLIENFTDETPANWVTKAWLKYVFRMWDHPKAAPEYQLSWVNRRKARACLERILAWDFTRIVLAHGELIQTDAKAAARRAWSTVLR